VSVRSVELGAPTGRRVELTRLRRAIAKGMTASAAVPQFTVESDADLRAVAQLRETLDTDARPSYADLLTAACAQALVAHPRLNASFDEDAIIEHEEVNIGLAVAVPDGLVAPAVLGADRRSLAELAAERRRLTEAATAGTLTPADLLSATFTISNLGPLGVRRFRALVVPPQAAILAVGRLTADQAMSLSLSCDHRVVDGAPAALFLADVVQRLTDPGWVREAVR
jgi:pyruvate dehydrogenase E2 component (dihydrolipoamide acetyltransferase)